MTSARRAHTHSAGKAIRPERNDPLSRIAPADASFLASGRLTTASRNQQESHMTTRHTHHTGQLPLQAPTQTTYKTGREIIEQRRDRTAARKRTRLISARNRRVLAQWLRRTATHTQQPHPIARRSQTLLHYRVAAVHTELLEIAAMLEHAHHPDPAIVTEVHNLLANGFDSPLYNPDIHISELQATLHYTRAGLRAPSA